MSPHLAFAAAVPAAAAAQLDAGSIHLWRLPYAPAQGRGPLLELLGGYLDKPASGVRLEVNPRGKPMLAAAESPGHGLQFNWSHSGGHALAALALDLPLGVDIERADRRLRSVAVAERYFDGAEAEVLAALPGQAQGRAFIGLWCAKEALLKAAGEGIAFGLDRLVFRWRSGMDWDLAQVDAALGAKDEWRLRSFDAAPGYRGTLAWRGRDRRIAAFLKDSPHGN